MTAADFRSEIKECAEWATRCEPADTGYRARAFVAILSGSLKRREPALSALLCELVGLPADAAPASTPKAP